MLGEPAGRGQTPGGWLRVGGGGHLAEAGRVGRRGLEGGGAGEAGTEAGDRGDSGVGETRGGRVVEELGERGDDHDRDRARVGAVDDAVLDRLPALAQRAVEARRVVVEDEHLVDVGVLADERDDVALPVAVAPDDRGVVERVGDRGGGGEPLLERGGGGRRERGELDAEPLRLVRAEPRVAARAGEDPEPAAARPGAPDGECLGELEQVVHVVRPRRAGLARERAEHPLVAGERAGVGRGRGGADRRRPDLQHRHADPRVGARGERLAQRRAVPGVLDEQRDRAQLRLGREVGEPVGGADDRLVPGRDRGVEAEPAAGGERVDDEVAALRDQPDVPRLDPLQRIPPEGGAGVERDEPVAVRAADGERVPEGRARSSASSVAPAGASVATAEAAPDGRPRGSRRRRRRLRRTPSRPPRRSGRGRSRPGWR